MNLYLTVSTRAFSRVIFSCCFLLIAVFSINGANNAEDFDSDNLNIAERINGIYSPMVHLDINQVVVSYLRGYLDRRPQHTASLIGRAEIVFPKYEQWLAEENAPTQLKYISVLESALNPRGRSTAGAYGPWQFMPATGKIFHLDQTTYIDERADFEKSTRAAAAYMKQLFGMYDDWRLAFCAYNAGPGRVNRAIRMARTNRFDQVIRFLPRETQNYVPAFIAAMYVMNFYELHGIEPNYLPNELTRTHQVRVFDYTPFDLLAEAINMDEEHIKFLNPVFIRDIVPANAQGYIIHIPESSLESFYKFRPNAISEASFQALKKQDIQYRPSVSVDNPEVEYVNKVENVRKTYRVRSGDNLTVIAGRTGTTVNQLRSWNNIRGNVIHPNQRLTYYKRETVRVPVFREPEPELEENAVADDLESFNDLPEFMRLQQKVAGGKLAFNTAKNITHERLTASNSPKFEVIPSRTKIGDFSLSSVWDSFYLADGRKNVREIARLIDCCEITVMEINNLPNFKEIPKAGSFVKLPAR